MSNSITDQKQDSTFLIHFTSLESVSLESASLESISNIKTDYYTTLLIESEEGFMVLKTLEKVPQILKLTPVNFNGEDKSKELIHYEFLIGKHLSQLNNSIFTKTFAYGNGKFKYGKFVGIIQEYANGKTLNLCIKDKSLSLSQTLAIIKHIAIKIGKEEFTHYDLHDENILCSDDNKIKLIDFGRSYAPCISNVQSLYCASPTVLNGYTAAVFDPYIDFIQMISNLTHHKKEFGKDNVDDIINEFKEQYLNHNSYYVFEDKSYYFFEGKSYELNELVTKIVPFPKDIANMLEKYAIMFMDASPEGYLSIAYDTSNVEEINLETALDKLNLLKKEHDEIIKTSSDYSQITKLQKEWGLKHQKELYDIIYGFKKWFVANKQGFVRINNGAKILKIEYEIKQLKRKEFVSWFVSFIDEMISLHEIKRDYPFISESNKGN
jgi:serine/threonine protein kinase